MKSSPADAHIVEGEKHLEVGEWGEAEASFRHAVEADPTSAAAFSKLGVALVRQGRTDEAEQAFGRAVAVNPRYAPAWSNLGNVYHERGRNDEALEAYQRAIAADPDYYIAYQNLGSLYKQMGRIGEAIAARRRATRLSMKAAVARPPAGRGRPAGCLGRAAVLVILLTVLAGALVPRLVSALR
jgi:superkiller protein 3